MPWFRRRKKQHDEAPAAAGAAVPAAHLPPVEADRAEDVAAAQDEKAGVDAGDQQKKRRRRGSRGGRGRKKAVDAAEATPDRPATAAEGKARQKDDRGDRRRQARRRQQPRRAPLPAAKRELLISVDIGEQRAAVLEDDKVAEVYLERPERRSIAGNIYLGVVDNILPGMEAAFVEIGLEKNGFLYVDEIVVPELEGRRHGKKIQDLISRGETILVQAVKDPMKTKGARLTTEVSLPGRFLVYVPNGEGLGVSRRLEDAERQRLKDIIRELDPKGGGVIVRTAAEGASADDIERDLVFLQRLWKTIQARAKDANPPTLVYQEAELPLRLVRDLFAGDFQAAHIDHERTHKRIVGYLKKTSPHMLERVHRYKEREPLFLRYGVDREIESTLSRRVELPSGGYLVFDYAEAFTVIDVNTGRFVGSRSKSSSQRLEDTITKNNLEAVNEVVRQLRLRDIGGIIVIDFIDMANPKNRATVEEALRNELERDRTKTYVVEISPLGLVEMTRQNVTDGPREILTRKCPVCDGDGIVVSEQTIAMQVERRLRELCEPGSRTQAYRVAVHPRILALLAGSGGDRLASIEEAARRRFFLQAATNGHVHTDHFEVLAEGKLADVAPEAPVAEGAELEIKLVEVGLHDAGAGVGKLDGYDIVVAGAAKLVGRKATVRVGRALEGQAFAALVGVDDGSEPITFESEAEKPTRAPSRRKPTEAAVDVEGVPADEAATADAEHTADAASGDGAAPAKKARRGTRGGRRRRKKATDVPELAEGTAEEGSEDAESPAPEAEPEKVGQDGRKRRRTPRIHVPPAEAETPSRNGPAPESVSGLEGEAPGETSGEDEPTPRKRTRRGSRGGRGRKRRTASTIEGDASEAPATEAKADMPNAYVPMSEWIEDFGR